MRKVSHSIAMTAKVALALSAVVLAVVWYVSATSPVFAAPSGSPFPAAHVGGSHVGSLASGARPQSPHEPCSSRKNCLSCLFDPLSATRRADDNECVWCASTGLCQSAGPNAPTCDDVEDFACPAVLHSKVPQNFRVIHVGIRKGGPEALVQLHLALVHWGFSTTLDTRKSKKEKGGPVMPFFLEAYKDEFKQAPPLRWVRDYDDWHSSAVDGDVLIATETWACKNDAARYMPKGVRQMQWHLTVWPRRDRSQCTIAGHTRYVAATYMRQSERALMFPYISPHILALAASKSNWKQGKENLVLYDSDTKLADKDLVSSHGVVREAKIATGYTPEQLYALYGRAKAGIDIQLPGGERFVYEAALFDVCVIVDNALNGLDKEDFPLPDMFRVPPGNLSAMNAAVDRCIADYDSVIPLFAPLKDFVRKQKVTFLRQVRRYYSNSVHIVGVVCSQEEADKFAFSFIVGTLLQIPFAVLEIQLPLGVSLDHRTWQYLFDNSWLAAVVIRNVHGFDADLCRSAPHRAFVEKPNAWIPQTSAKRTLVTVVTHIATLFVSHEFVALTSSLLAMYKLRGRASPAALEFPVAGTDRFVLGLLTKDLEERCSSGNLASCPMLRVSSDVSQEQQPLLAVFESLDTSSTLAETLSFFCRHEVWQVVRPTICTQPTS